MNNIQHRYISCVEYYLLNHLNDRMDIRKLYYESYIPYYQLCKDFFNQSVSFIDYSQIPRIQKTLSAHQYITFLSRFIIPYDELDKQNFIHLLLVNSSFFDSKKIKSLRSDHYVQIKKENEEIVLLNSYPIGIEKTNLKKINQWFDHQTITYKVTGLDKLDKDLVYSLFKKHFAQYEFKENSIDLTTMKLQSIVFLLKVTRYRLYDICKFFQGNHLIDNEALLKTILEAAQYYEDLFLKLSMLAFKKNDIRQELSSINYKINNYEKKIYYELRKIIL